MKMVQVKTLLLLPNLSYEQFSEVMVNVNNHHYINSTLIILHINSSEDHYTHPIEAQDDGTNGLLIIPKQPKRH